MIHRALGGSNVSGFSTGNQSPPLDAKPNFDPGGAPKHDTFVIEPKDKNWADAMRKQQDTWRTQGQPIHGEPAAISIMHDVADDLPAPRAQPVVPRAQPVNPTAQTDTDLDGTLLADTDFDDATDYTGPHLGGHFGAVNA